MSSSGLSFGSLTTPQGGSQMLPGKMTLPEGILPLAGQAFNQLFHLVSVEADKWLSHELMDRLKEPGKMGGKS
jgi:hypothetical protein